MRFSVYGIVAAVFFFIAAFCVYLAVSLIFNYESPTYTSDNSFSGGVNAYVGSDANNLQINASYFSGLCALGGCSLVCSAMFFIAGVHFDHRDSD